MSAPRVTVETTDGRYNLVVPGEWWDTTGIDIVPQDVVDRYLDDNPRVGIVVIGRSESGEAAR